jgi:hypothetical protein
VTGVWPSRNAGTLSELTTPDQRCRAGTVRCSHVFGLLVRHTRPLAIMPSADQVPVKSPHSTMHWHMWVVLIAGSAMAARVRFSSSPCRRIATPRRDYREPQGGYPEW